MSLAKLQKKLRREATANPKKAAILGLLLLVASYFWMPLVWGFVAKKDLPVRPSAEKSAGPVLLPGPLAVPMKAAPLPSSDNPETIPWEQLVKWLEEDPAARPAADLTQRRDPFRPIVSEVVDAEPEENDVKKPQVVEVELTPESVGLQLTSTMVGPNRRLALINGVTYREGGTVASSAGTTAVEFRLAEVHSRLVVLEREGKRFELTLPQPATSGRIELLRSGN